MYKGYAADSAESSPNKEEIGAHVPKSLNPKFSTFKKSPPSHMLGKTDLSLFTTFFLNFPVKKMYVVKLDSPS